MSYRMAGPARKRQHDAAVAQEGQSLVEQGATVLGKNAKDLSSLSGYPRVATLNSAHG